MEMEKRIVIAMSLCMIVYMLFMYNQMNALKKSCGECGEEVRTDMQFPDGASAIFVVSDAFDAYLKE